MAVKETDKNVIGKGKAGPGRPKGSVNRTTGLLKDAILQAAQKAGGDGPDGMVEYLTAQAKENPGPFMSLLGKVLPMTVVGDPNNPFEIVTRIEMVSVKPDGDTAN